MQTTGAPTQRAATDGHPPRANAGIRYPAAAATPSGPAAATAPDDAAMMTTPPARTPRRSRPWALINHTRRQHVDIGPDGVYFERDPIRYMRTVLSLAWSASDDMVMLPARHMLPAGHTPEAYTEALVWPVPSDDAASSSSSSSGSSSSQSGSDSDSDWDDDDAYSSDYDSGSFDSDDDGQQQPHQEKEKQAGDRAKDAVVGKDAVGASAAAAPRRNR
ncbi:hypothetical protein pqer_cds_389 [Pandoravirus quercus]|uniref:Uncharacterized protein n=1 Tax=Pandoravirus quercus TaxID=2107709 RepID=A0A2U7U8P6_9VIRU|nr:hypothetical protein pqer_cds_389 [Pandoravirus quercus]AVK74811.1 hypothetical protein pqer_cds_389 [Pandoravirus quercus]